MNILRKISVILTFTLVFTFTLTECGKSDKNNKNNREQDNNSKTENQSSQNTDNTLEDTTNMENENTSDNTSNDTAAEKEKELEVQFGDDGTPFIMHLYDNDTAEAIIRHVGTANWRLPIYHYDDYDNWEVMQYYDIPSRYDIP